MYVSMYTWWSSFKPIAFVLGLKVYMPLPILRPHCGDVPNKGLIKYQQSALILLHGDPNNEFQLELEEFIFCRHILTCYVGKCSIIVWKL